ncbi:MAG TPA: mechanosensitive ion channel domain-containing protein [Bryobacteraceae bacterium]|nr:mechanosensitive ion channel domain-containing protein [Bryobacteraceae bacterium]
MRLRCLGWNLGVVMACALSSAWAQTSAAVVPASGSVAIPLVEINSRSEDLVQHLRRIRRLLPGKVNLERLDKALIEDLTAIRDRASDSDSLFANNPTLTDARGEERYWRSYTRPDGTRLAIANAVRKTNSSVAFLEEQEITWKATLHAISASGVSAVIETVRQSLSSIQQLKGEALEQRTLALTLQIKASRIDAIAGEELDKVERAMTEFEDRLFSKDGYRFWQFGPRREQERERSAIDRTMIQRSLEGGKAFLSQEPWSGFVFATLLLLGVWLIVRLHKTFEECQVANSSVTDALQLTSRPVALAFIAMLPFGIVLLRQAPGVVMSVAMLGVLIPLGLIAKQVWRRRIRLSHWIIMVLFFAHALLEILTLSSELKRNLIVMLTVMSAALCSWLAWQRTRMPETFSGKGSQVVTKLLWCVAIAFTCSLVANLLGYLTLAQVLKQTTLRSTFAGIVTFITGHTTLTLAIALIHATRLRSLSVVKAHGEAIETWLKRAIVAAGLYFWLFMTLDLLSMKDNISAFLDRILTARIPVPGMDFSLSDVLIFGSVLLVGYLLATAIRVTLREDVLSRFKLQRGIPALISASIYYVLLVCVFLTAVNAAGVKLDKFTLLTGAVGVGLGFGLQNVVNNFASGLILQFERPINVGDSLDVGTISGTVSRIGFRSSTIVTAQGAEVIIPNATLVSGQVTNWTLHQTCRRVEIPVRTTYNADPKHVNELLLNIATKNTDVVKEPPPISIFKGFGENALEFELMLWTLYATHQQVRSEVAMSIYSALANASIEIPLPQREIHVRGITTNDRDSLRNGRESENQAIRA